MVAISLPNTAKPESTYGCFSGFGNELLARGNPELSCNVAILAGPRLAPRGTSRLAYRFEGAAPPEFFDPPGPLGHPFRQYRNPIAVAREWRSMLDTGRGASRADLARQIGVTRARVTQILALLEIAPEVVQALAALGDALPQPFVARSPLLPLRLPSAGLTHLAGPALPHLRADLLRDRAAALYAKLGAVTDLERPHVAAA